MSAEWPEWPSEDERRALRLRVADHIEAHPELHDQTDWGDDADSGDPSCGTACCVAGWACRLGGGTRGMDIPVAALHLLSVRGMPAVEFSSHARRDQILSQLRGTIAGTGCADCEACAHCEACTHCSGCWDCWDCSGCWGCTGVYGGRGLRGVSYPARAVEQGMRALAGGAS